MDMSRIQVISQGAFEHGRILRDDGQTAAEVKQANRGDIESVDAEILSVYEMEDVLQIVERILPNSTVDGFNDAEEG